MADKNRHKSYFHFLLSCSDRQRSAKEKIFGQLQSHSLIASYKQSSKKLLSLQRTLADNMFFTFLDRTITFKMPVVFCIVFCDHNHIAQKKDLDSIRHSVSVVKKMFFPSLRLSGCPGVAGSFKMFSPFSAFILSLCTLLQNTSALS